MVIFGVTAGPQTAGSASCWTTSAFGGGVRKLFAFLGATVGGYAGWYAGAIVGFTTAFIVSMIGTGVGIYVGNRMARNYE